jgi:hypothetical protein
MASQSHRRVRWAVGRTEYHATRIIRQAHPGAPRLRAQYLLLAILCLFIPGCSREPHPATIPLARYAENQREIDGTVFGTIRPDHTDEYLAALASAQILPDPDRSRVFVPFLMAYPGWFDIGYAPLAAQAPASLTLDQGRVRIFRHESMTFVMILSPAAAKYENRLSPPLPEDGPKDGATAPPAPPVPYGAPRPWWQFWR